MTRNIQREGKPGNGFDRPPIKYSQVAGLRVSPRGLFGVPGEAKWLAQQFAGWHSIRQWSRRQHTMHSHVMRPDLRLNQAPWSNSYSSNAIK